MINLWKWQNLSSVLFQICERFYSLILSLVIISALVLTRGSDHFNWPYFAKVQNYLFYSALAFSALMLLKEHRKLIAGIAILWLLIRFHAILNFFPPPLYDIIHLEDHLLSEHVSAMWSLSVTKIESQNFLGYFTIFLPVFLIADLPYRKQIFQTLVFSIVANIVVAGVQSFWNPEFLGGGSGTARLAKRAAGLLEDSGAFSIFLSILTSAFIWVLALAKFKRFQQIYLSLIVLVLLMQGAWSCGRIFIISTFFSIFLLTLYNLFKMLFTKSWRLGIYTLLFCVASIALVSVLSKTHSTNALENLKSWEFVELLSPERWQEIDYQRIQHMRIMWEATKESFPIGSGLGSFHNFSEKYTKLRNITDVTLDWPSSFYLQMLSELGLTGLLLLLALGFIFANGLYLKKITNTHYFMMGGFFCMLIAWLIGIHYIFSSIALLTGFGLAYFWSKLTKNNRFFVNLICNSASLCLFLSCLYIIFMSKR